MELSLVGVFIVSAILVMIREKLFPWALAIDGIAIVLQVLVSPKATGIFLAVVVAILCAMLIVSTSDKKQIEIEKQCEGEKT